MTGRTSPDATVSVNGLPVSMDSSGEFSSPPIDLTTGPNLIEIVASDLSGETRDMVLTVTLAPGGQPSFFGRVTIVRSTAPGVRAITVTGPGGVATIDATNEATIVRIPGRDRALPSDISVGDVIAVLARESGDRMAAEQILVKPGRAVVHTQINGVKVAAPESQVSLMDVAGNLVTVDLTPGTDPAKVEAGRVVTAILVQDLDTGRLTLVDTERAVDKIERLTTALDQAVAAGADENRRNLQGRLEASVTGQLSTLREVANRVDPSVKFVFDQSFDTALRSFESLLSEAEAGPPLVRLSGQVADIDPVDETVLVSPREGPQVQLQLTASTVIHIFGTLGRPDNLEAGQHIGQRLESLYDPRTNEASTLSLLRPTLERNLVGALLDQAKAGELEGVVLEVNAVAVSPTLVVRLPTDETVTLKVPPGTVVRVRDESAELGDLGPGALVKVRYDPATMNALNVDTFDRLPGIAFISGVVVTRIKEASVSIVTLDGESVTLAFKAGSVVERDGGGVPPGAVRPGDVVRPISRYDTRTDEVVRLVLMAEGPRITGTVRGSGVTPSQTRFVTVSTDDTDMVTVTVSNETGITKSGEDTVFNEVNVGDRVEAEFNIRTSAAFQLDLANPTTVGTSGRIIALDPVANIVTVAPDAGTPLQLLVPNKPGKIVLDGNPSADFGQLEVGDEVLAAFFKPDSKEVVRIIVVSQ